MAKTSPEPQLGIVNSYFGNFTCEILIINYYKPDFKRAEREPNYLASIYEWNDEKSEYCDLVHQEILDLEVDDIAKYDFTNKYLHEKIVSIKREKKINKLLED